METALLIHKIVALRADSKCLFMVSRWAHNLAVVAMHILVSRVQTTFIGKPCGLIINYRR